MGGAAACRPSSPESLCRGGGWAPGEPSLPPLARVAPKPAGTGDKPSSDFPLPEQGPRVAAPVRRASDRPSASSGAPEWCALGPGRRGRRSGRTDLPAPPAPAASHLRPAPPSPSLAQWLHSFLPGHSTNIYRVPTMCPVPGRMPQGCGEEESEAALPSRGSHLEVAKVRPVNLRAVVESTGEGARESEKAPRRWPPSDLDLLSSLQQTPFALVTQSPPLTPTRLPALLPWPFLPLGTFFPCPSPLRCHFLWEPSRTGRDNVEIKLFPPNDITFIFCTSLPEIHTHTHES